MIADAVSHGQGTVTFVNAPGTLVSAGPQGQESLVTGPGGSYYFGLLIAAPGTTQPNLFTFTGLYATNDGAFPGRLVGGSNVPVPGWSAGGFMSFFVAGWSASFGHDWNQQWMNGTFSTTGDFGFSSIATAQSGSPGAPPISPLWLFNPVDGIQTGFDLVTVPEPATLTFGLAGGGAMLCRWRRRIREKETRLDRRRSAGVGQGRRYKGSDRPEIAAGNNDDSGMDRASFAHGHPAKLPKLKAAAIEALEQINLHAAGIDVGSAQNFACVPVQAVKTGQSNVRSFGAFTKHLDDLVEWLKECGITTAAMEATSRNAKTILKKI